MKLEQINRIDQLENFLINQSKFKKRKGGMFEVCDGTYLRLNQENEINQEIIRKHLKQLGSDEWYRIIVNNDLSNIVVLRKSGSPNQFKISKFRGRAQTLQSKYQKLNKISFEDNVINNSLENLFDVKDLIDKFYKEYWALKTKIAKSVSNFNGTEDERYTFAQVILDRIIFIYFLQAKGLIKQDYLKNLYHNRNKRHNFYEFELKRLFFDRLNNPNQSEIPYLNGGLFKKKDFEKKNPKADIPNTVWKKLFELFESYEWVIQEERDETDVLTPYILGHIFERSMNADQRKGTGAYYTPEEITKYISENTIYPWLLDRVNERFKLKLKKIDEIFEKLTKFQLRVFQEEILRKITICDNACGSGAFLLTAANILFRLHIRTEEKSGGKIGLPSSFALRVREKKRILKDNIYGVDINPDAIEIARLRLWLWIVESYDEKSKKIDALPNLDYKLREGNSLIGYVSFNELKENLAAFSEFNLESEKIMLKNINNWKRKQISSSGKTEIDLSRKIDSAERLIKEKLDVRYMHRVDERRSLFKEKADFLELKPFHWIMNFYNIFSEGGFDVVIGNPPYVRQEFNMESKPILSKIYKVHSGRSDLYVYFYERSMDLLASRGELGFISSNKFLNASYGVNLRRTLLMYDINKIIDFGDARVFEGITTYPAILLIRKSQDRGHVVRKYEFDSMYCITDMQNQIATKVKREDLTLDFIFEDRKTQEIWLKIQENGIPLKELNIPELAGIKTGFNKAYYIKDKTMLNSISGEGLLKQCALGRDIKKYSKLKRGRYIIFPYRWDKSRSEYVLVDINKFPKTKQYLEKFKNKLKKRAIIKDGLMNGTKTWYEYQQINKKYKFDNPKITYPDLSNDTNFTMDTEGFVIDMGAFYIPTKDYGLLGILNSNLVRFMLCKNIIRRRGGYKQFKVQYIENIPINTSAKQKVASLVRNYYKSKNEDKFSELDKIIYKVYNITEYEEYIESYLKEKWYKH